MKRESQLVTYAAGPVKSTVDYIIVRHEDKAKVRNVKVIPGVPKHKMLVMDMQFNTTKKWREKFEPRVHVRNLKEDKTYKEYQSTVKDKVAEAEWKYLDVNELWWHRGTLAGRHKNGWMCGVKLQDRVPCKGL